MNHTQRLEESFRGLGLNERQAAVAAAGRDPADTSGFDGLVAAFRGLGMTESAAKIAAVGRDVSESEARRAFDQATRPGAGDDWQRRFDRLQAMVAEASDKDLAAIVERRSGKGRSASKKKASAPARSRVTIQERATARENAYYTELREVGVPPGQAAREAARRVHGGSSDRRVVALRECLAGGG